MTAFDHPFFALMAPVEPLPPGTGLKFERYDFASRFTSFW